MSIQGAGDVIVRLKDGKLFSRHKDDVKVVPNSEFGKEFDDSNELSFVWGDKNTGVDTIPSAVDAEEEVVGEGKSVEGRGDQRNSTVLGPRRVQIARGEGGLLEKRVQRGFEG